MKAIHKTNLIAAVIITLLVFSVGILIGNWTSKSKLSDLDDMQGSLITGMLDFKMESDIAGSDPCDMDILEALNSELGDMGNKIEFLENQKITDDKLRVLKKYYMLTELEHWNFVKSMNAACNYKYSTILFFYAPNKECPSCTLQGLTLDLVKKENPEVMIYSLDINSDSKAVDLLKKKFGVKYAPSLVINGLTQTDLKNADDILNKIKEYQEQTEQKQETTARPVLEQLDSFPAGKF